MFPTHYIHTQLRATYQLAILFNNASKCIYTHWDFKLYGYKRCSVAIGVSFLYLTSVRMCSVDLKFFPCLKMSQKCHGLHISPQLYKQFTSPNATVVDTAKWTHAVTTSWIPHNTPTFTKSTFHLLISCTDAFLHLCQCIISLCLSTGNNVNPQSCHVSLLPQKNAGAKSPNTQRQDKLI